MYKDHSQRGTTADAEKDTGRPFVLVVDDDRQLRNAMRRSLEVAGCTVAVACDGDDAVRALTREEFSVVVLDLQMQPQNGWFVLRELVERVRLTPRTGSCWGVHGRSSR